jgi:Tol biopolymer transport system component
MGLRTGAALAFAALLWGRLGGAAENEPPQGMPGPADGSDPSDGRWRTMETPHFRIHFYEDERRFADRAAPIAERAYRLITRYLNWQPSGRVDMVLNDQTDSANGFASSLPFNFVFGFGAPPAPLDELNDFDDWVKVLITHELTHVVHLDTIIGAPRVVNFLLGKVYAPNLSQPNWFIEGLAILMESRHTTAGRIRSSFFDMHLRVPFIEGRVLGLDAVSNRPFVYPQGTAAYLYGGSLLRYIEDRYGPDRIREISHRYGNLLIPGGLNRVARQSLGIGYEKLWDDWMQSLTHRFALQVEDAERRGITATERLTREAPGPRSDGFTPRFFRDGGLLFHRINNDQAPAYVRMDLGTGERRVLLEAYAGGAAAPTPDGRGLVFQQTAFQALPRRISGSSHVDWDDLFLFDLESQDIRPLTRGRRAHEPDVSPDGALVACTLTGPTGRDLAVVPVMGGDPRILASTAGTGSLAYSPAWSPDGKLIAYSRWKLGGYRDIHLYDLANKTDRALWVDRAMDLDPRFSPDGRFILFSSDRTGIYNIFAYELASGRLYQVTNILSGAFQPAVSPDGTRLVFTGFTSDGFDLFAAPYDPGAWGLAQPFANTRPDSSPVPGDESDSPDGAPADPNAPPVVQRIGRYQPWRYLYPRAWTLSYLSDPLGLGGSGRVQTTVSDPVGNHGVAIDVIVPAGGDASARLDYVYNGFWPSLTFTLTRSALAASNLVMDGANVSYRQHASSASVSMGLPFLRRADASADLSFGYSYSVYGPADPIPLAEPTAGITIKPETGPDANLFMSWSFSNAHAWQYSISAQEGRRLQLSLQFSEPALGGKFQTTEVTWAWTEYWTPLWARLHAVAVLYSGGVGIGDKRAFFGIGGFLEQDLVRSIFLNRRQCCQFLRGYAPGSLVGDQYHLVSAEYRAPLLRIEKGYKTFPFYFRTLNGAVFADAGNAFSDSFRPQDVKVGVGGELRLQFNVAYYLDSELQVGVARGLSKGGSNQVYVVTSFPF